MLLILSSINHCAYANEETEELRRLLDRLGTENDTRIQPLEDRLTKAEETAKTAQQSADDAMLIADELI